MPAQQSVTTDRAHQSSIVVVHLAAPVGEPLSPDRRGRWRNKYARGTEQPTVTRDRLRANPSAGRGFRPVLLPAPSRHASRATVTDGSLVAWPALAVGPEDTCPALWPGAIAHPPPHDRRRAGTRRSATAGPWTSAGRVVGRVLPVVGRRAGHRSAAAASLVPFSAIMGDVPRRRSLTHPQGRLARSGDTSPRGRRRSPPARPGVSCPPPCSASGDSPLPAPCLGFAGPGTPVPFSRGPPPARRAATCDKYSRSRRLG